MECLALLDSGNYVFRFNTILTQLGYPVEVIPTPCTLAKEGCGYCLRFPEQYMNFIIQLGVESNIHVRRIYSVNNVNYKNVYKAIYP